MEKKIFYLPVISQLGESWKENCERTRNSHFTRTQPEILSEKYALRSINNFENGELGGIIHAYVFPPGEAKIS